MLSTGATMLTTRASRGLEPVEQKVRQQEMRQVVHLERHLEAVGRLRSFTQEHARVVHEQVNDPTPVGHLAGRRAYGGEPTEVTLDEADLAQRLQRGELPRAVRSRSGDRARSPGRPAAPARMPSRARSPRCPRDHGDFPPHAPRTPHPPASSSSSISSPAVGRSRRSGNSPGQAHALDGRRCAGGRGACREPERGRVVAPPATQVRPCVHHVKKALRNAAQWQRKPCSMVF